MNIYLLSSNQKYLKYWNETIHDAIIISIENINNIQENDIVIADIKDERLDKINTKIILLDNIPTFEKCMESIRKDVKAYGNVYMHSSHILSAIESLKEEKIWIYPEFLAQMIGISESKSNSMIEERISCLTKREKEIAKLVLDGLTNKEIAIKLELSANTIKIHLSHIYKKLQVTDRLSLFSYLNY